MLLKLEKIIAKYGMKITGVIQAGANEGQEMELFKQLGITDGVLFEPCVKPFNELVRKLYGDFEAYNCALSEKDGVASMWVTDFNNGQSNSLLQPKKHLEYYPDIVFNEKEDIAFTDLDWFGINHCNLLMMDVQGYELEVLKGATETLKHIDYIYTEVNREELYENCAMVEDLDNYLTEFKRVETKWKRKGFGDALYIRKTLL